ncbi:YncE family protein [Solitalea sp. MAHUQ-68]|uniref:YncE family protein n=1 Tax=Solitalea agri TaxID=2953739 RepID=A0A9X2F0D1_9SPHI|nr:YncE family protein [Solitalea agri]MCO4291755.1 YncE family protein [Solitalea agri]
MRKNLFFVVIFLLGFMTVSCNKSKAVIEKRTETSKVSKVDTLVIIKPIIKPYSHLTLDSSIVLQSAPGTKSVLFNSSQSRLYALNLEGLSIYEFGQASKQLIREFKFKPSIGKGWNYDDAKEIISYREKPVEAAISNHDSILWVSLHNNGGITPIFLQDVLKMKTVPTHADSVVKQLQVVYETGATPDTVFVPLIATGKTPKVIAVDEPSQHLLVSNWHSKTTSVLAINSLEFPYAHLVKNISTGAIPRGIAIDQARQKSYIAIMGGAQINVLDNKTWSKDTILNVSSNPRHIVTDDQGRLFISYNMFSQIACVDPVTGKTLFTAKTSDNPRTIALSKNNKFLFVTCYKGNKLEIFKIEDNGFTQIYSLKSNGAPVGVDLFEDDNKLEAWVCNYTIGAIKVFIFNKSQSELNIVSAKPKSGFKSAKTL